ncbi:hypothetical protein Tco_1216365 [Tanacetum coccineum]
MKVIKKEYEVLWLLMIDVDLFTCDTPLGITFDEFNRLSEMDDDLSTYKVRIPRLSYPPFDEPRCDNLDNYDHEVYKQSLCYDHEEKSYAEVVIFRFRNSKGATDRPAILEKGNYIPWESRFRRFLENKGEDEERMWYSITK